MYEFFIHGIPEQQGSTRAFVVKGRAHITSTNKNLGSWRQLIRDVAQQYAGTLHTQAIRIEATFFMPKPKSAPKRVVTMTKRPDIDKLERALLDALTGIIYKDDSQVTEMHTLKVYAESTDPVGVQVRITCEPEPEPKRKLSFTQEVQVNPDYV